MKLIALLGGVRTFFVFLSQLAQGRGGNLVKQLTSQQAALLRHFAQVGFFRAFLHRAEIINRHVRFNDLD
jgi:hypothetical protein